MKLFCFCCILEANKTTQMLGLTAALSMVSWKILVMCGSCHQHQFLSTFFQMIIFEICMNICWKKKSTRNKILFKKNIFESYIAKESTNRRHIGAILVTPSNFSSIISFLMWTQTFMWSTQRKFVRIWYGFVFTWELLEFEWVKPHARNGWSQT